MIVYVTKGNVPSSLPRRAIERTAAEVTRALKAKASGTDRLISVAFVTPRVMATYNSAYRGKPTATDVLSFEAMPGSRTFPVPATATEGKEQGDLIICPSYARAEARKRGVPLDEELVRLLVHGTLHLFGYDHERIADERAMFAIQESVVQQLMHVPAKKRTRI